MAIPDDCPRPAPVVTPQRTSNGYAVRLRASLSCKQKARDVVTFAVRQGQSMMT
jgi:hypothetical protein